MNVRKPLALALAALAGGAILAPQAGAGVRWSTPTVVALPAICATNHAVDHSVLTLNDTNDIATWVVSARPGCEGAVVTLAAHRTAFDRWEPSEVQPLISSNSMVLSAEPVSFRLRVDCGSQIDAVVGAALDVVDSTHRYNELSIGGTINRLVEARYTGVDCPPPATTTPTTQPEELTPVTTVATTPLPPITIPVTSILPPPTILEVATPFVDEPLTEAPTTSIPTVTADTLPVTGAGAEAALLGGSTVGFGLLSLAASTGLARLRRHTASAD